MNLRFLRLPQESEALSPPFFISVSGDSEITLSPCRRVLIYESDCIRIETVGCTVEIRGGSLSLSAYHGKDVHIKGLIVSVAIERSA